MSIWVDADACPGVIKEILYRAAIRTKTTTTFVANHLLTVVPSPFIKRVQVPFGFDVADNHIVQNIVLGDLVITADIPLADAVVDKGALALNPRGYLYSKNNIKQKLSMRDFSEGLRNSGVITGGPAKLGKKEIQAFANCLDQFLTGSLVNSNTTRR
jgi:uncharacterized protein YaiI (UPF0178 family)